MKKLIHLAVLIIGLTVSGCTKEEDDPTPDFTVKYEVTTASGDKWYGEYINETGEKICLCTSQQLATSGWTYTFSAKAPFVLHIDATAESPFFGTENAPDVTTKIYVNGEVVATNTSRWAKGVTSSDHELK